MHTLSTMNSNAYDNVLYSYANYYRLCSMQIIDWRHNALFTAHNTIVVLLQKYFCYLLLKILVKNKQR